LFIFTFVSTVYHFTYIRGRRVRYRMVVRLKTTYAISDYHLRLPISNPAKVCQRLATGRLISPDTPASFSQ
jgi:hypothetical protein